MPLQTSHTYFGAFVGCVFGHVYQLLPISDSIQAKWHGFAAAIHVRWRPGPELLALLRGTGAINPCTVVLREGKDWWVVRHPSP